MPVLILLFLACDAGNRPEVIEDPGDLASLQAEIEALITPRTSAILIAHIAGGDHHPLQTFERSPSPAAF